ncbi:hypothetical protein ACFW4K_26775 [Nocardiopsis alba]|uniref:hypothetical protein n=1 Tax=Nocardiopsis alba TaxID=53437 RepID=UPI00366EA191
MRTLTTRVRVMVHGLRDAVDRTWNTIRLILRRIRSRPYASGGYLPTGSAWARNSTGRPEPVLAPPPPVGGGVQILKTDIRDSAAVNCAFSRSEC